MIVKMKKLHLFISESSLGADLTLLGHLGAVHIIPYKPAQDESIDRVYERIEMMSEAVTILEEFDSDPLPELERRTMLPQDLHGEVTFMEEVLKADHKRKELHKQLAKLQSYNRWYNDWGNVDAYDIKELSDAGLYIRFYSLNKKEYSKLEKRNDLFIVGQTDKHYRLALISFNKDAMLPFEEIKAPKFRQSALYRALEETQHDIDRVKKALQVFHTSIHLLKDALEERYRRYQVRFLQYGGRSVEEKFSCWKGYIPEHSVDEFTSLAENNNWGYILQEPEPDEMDEVPTLIKTKKWANTIKPIMSFMGLVPGYNEMDVSKIFMIFFTFFSGILVGDAGYGFTFLLITLLVHYKQKFKRKIEFSLMYTLSVSIMIWGALTGTYFGVKEFAEIPVISNLVISKIASFGGDDLFLQKFMFIIGAIHLSIGHLQLALKHIRSVKAISQLGWIAIIWSLYLFINDMVLLIPAPSYLPYLFIAGGSMVALFSNPGQNFLRGLLASLADIPLNVISGFSDIISYIRLYAVGLATVLMAVSFNEMAIGEGITTVFSGIAAVLILILGHAMNMALAGMAVIVHGVRLNMLEYAGHAGVEFAGNAYNPFKIKKDIEENN